MNITVKGYNINYIDKGQGPTVVLLHGWGSSCGAFNYIVNNFCDSFRMIAPDLPGFGKSDMLNEPWTVSDYVDFAAEFISALGVEAPILVGHSFGGRVIIKGVGDGRLTTSKIILLDSAGVKPKKSFKSKVKQTAFKVSKAFLSFKPWRRFTANSLEKLRSKFGSADYRNAPPVLRQTLVNAVNEDLQSYMPNIKAPTLLIWGENDTATPVSDAKIMEMLIPDSGLCVIKGGGHFSFIDSPYEVNAIINSFIGG